MSHLQVLNKPTSLQRLVFLNKLHDPSNSLQVPRWSHPHVSELLAPYCILQIPPPWHTGCARLVGKKAVNRAVFIAAPWLGNSQPETISKIGEDFKRHPRPAFCL